MPAAIAGAIGAYLFSAGVALEVVNAVTFATLFALNTAVTVGLSLAANLLFRPGAPQEQTLKPSDVQQVIKQPVPARVRSYGTVRMAGVLFWFDTVDSGTTSTLYLGVALNQGRIAGFLQYHVDDVEVTLTASGFGIGTILTEPYLTSTGSHRIRTHLGLSTETAYADLLSQFSVGEVRGDGVASALVNFRNAVDSQTQSEVFPTGVPRLRFTFQAQTVWDPRAPRQSRADESTYAWSDNPAVCLLHYLIDPDGMGLDYEIDIEPNLDEWVEAMDICDEQVFSVAAAAMERRYRVSGTYQFSDKPSTVVAKFLSTCDGRCWVRRDGTIGIKVGRFVEPSVVIRNVDVIECDLLAGRDPLDAVAGIRAQYLSPSHDYYQQDADPWPTAEEVLELGEERVAPLDLTWTDSHATARRLMKRQFIRENGVWHGTVRCGVAALRAMDERFIRLRIDRLGIDDTFEVGHYSLDLSGPIEVTMEVLQVGAEIDIWDPATEEGTPPGATVADAYVAGAKVGSVSGFGQTSVRVVIPGTEILASGIQVRVWLGFDSGSRVQADAVSIAVRSSVDDALAVPTPVLFGGVAAADNLSTFNFRSSHYSAIPSDWTTFTATAGTDLLVTVDCPSTSNVDYADDTAKGDAYFYNDGPYSSVQAPSAFATESTARAYLISKIEVRGA